MLNITAHGPETDLPPLLIAPGLFGSGRNWGVIAKNLSAERRVLALDLRNHGDSSWDDSHTYPELAADIAQVIEAEGRACDLLGHSMGGKTAMMLALMHPGLVERLVVADIAPVAYGHGATHEGLIAAMQGLKIDDLTSRMEADRRLSESVHDKGTRAFLLQSLELREGPVRWKLNLEALKANLPAILGWPDLPTGVKPFAGQTLFLSGGNSNYLLPEHHEKIRALFPHADFEVIEGAGHWLHAERPRQVEAAIAAFLTR
ncbi:pimeloyl-ACP methyl ester carboxylesterase [Rhodobacter sp. JA431]|uniref:alpha/beta fold hydrolase n=1 Tax=Rhodobacter sp. JA431 TaxID=570013 RepID=UPI000BC5F6AA|nr:alpha/beta fold hydrolase [Rhodobacter sp. JA431]SOB92713.1 pimeloyl-ACP methyl ester carboxylesterase [Rhodobacter sp. JA431]